MRWGGARGRSNADRNHSSGGSCTTTRYTGDGSNTWGQYSAATAYASGTVITLVARSASGALGIVLNSAASAVIDTLDPVGDTYILPSAQTYWVGFSSSMINARASWVDIQFCLPSSGPPPHGLPYRWRADV